MTILYHYCSASTFHSIVGKRSIWLSSLSMSNDTMEGKLASDIMARIAKEEGLGAALTEELRTALSFYENYVDGLGICLSTEGDLLSQWRGYAGDATGFAIGFDAAYLSELSLSLTQTKEHVVRVSQVIYDDAEQMERVRPSYIKFKEEIGDGVLAGAYNALALYGSDEQRQTYQAEVDDARRLLTVTLVGILAPLFILKTLNRPGFRGGCLV